jgi:hypothetical protein
MPRGAFIANSSQPLRVPSPRGGFTVPWISLLTPPRYSSSRLSHFAYAYPHPAPDEARAPSVLLNQNVPVLGVSRYLGHANPGITVKVYAHLIDGTSGMAATGMDKALG